MSFPAIAQEQMRPEDLATLKVAKGGTWYDGWQPYCMICSTMQRMTRISVGFRCESCGNIIKWDLTRHPDSPLASRIRGEHRHGRAG